MTSMSSIMIAVTARIPATRPSSSTRNSSTLPITLSRRSRRMSETFDTYDMSTTTKSNVFQLPSSGSVK